MKTSHSVTILGRELSVKSSAPAVKVQAVESFVNARLQEISAALKSSDAQLVLMLALLNTSEQYLDLRALQEAQAPLLEDRLRLILEKIDAA